jgi:hypothetical protein
LAALPELAKLAEEAEDLRGWRDGELVYCSDNSGFYCMAQVILLVTLADCADVASCDAFKGFRKAFCDEEGLCKQNLV